MNVLESEIVMVFLNKRKQKKFVLSGCRNASSATDFTESCTWKHTTTSGSHVGDNSPINNCQQFGGTEQSEHSDSDDSSDSATMSGDDEYTVKGGDADASINAATNETNDATSGGSHSRHRHETAN